MMPFISPSRFRDGGVAIFEVHIKNHIIAKGGRISWRPFKMRSLREFNRS